MLLEEYGVSIGLVLLGVVVACAFLLARRAAKSVQQFRAEHHERFTGGGER